MKSILLICSLLSAQSILASQEIIAYLGHTGGYWQVWTMTPQGEDKKQITDSKYDKSRISWFPGGNEILVNGSQGKLTRVNIDSLVERDIVLPIKGTVDAVVSPDGKHLAFSLSVADSIDNNDIWRVDIEGNDLTQMTNMNHLQHEPVWSHDAQWIYFLSGKGDESHDIWRTSIDKRIIEQVTSNQLYNFDVAFSREGHMVFSSNREGNYDIWIEKNNSVVKISNHESIDSRPALSPDGKRVVFESMRNDAMNIWLKAIGTNKVKQLTDETIGARHPIWSY